MLKMIDCDLDFTYQRDLNAIFKECLYLTYFRIKKHTLDCNLNLQWTTELSSHVSDVEDIKKRFPKPAFIEILNAFKPNSNEARNLTLNKKYELFEDEAGEDFQVIFDSENDEYRQAVKEEIDNNQSKYLLDVLNDDLGVVIQFA